MTNQNYDFDALCEQMHQWLEERNTPEVRKQLAEMNSFDIATFLTDLREESEALMVLAFLMLSKEQGAEVFAELEAPEQELIINSVSDKQLSNIIEEMYVDDAVDLMEELRGQGYGDLSAVHFAILETNGRLSVLPYASQKPPTARSLGLAPQEPGLPLPVISDGRLLEDNLKLRGYDRSWLDKRLAEHGLRRQSEVFLMTVDLLGTVVVVKKEGRK